MSLANISNKRIKLCDNSNRVNIPSLICDVNGFIDADEFLSTFQKYQAVYLPQIAKKDSFGWKSLYSLFNSLDQKDRDSWCIETKGCCKELDESFLSEECKKGATGYCSFLVQHSLSTLEKLLDQLPLEHLPLKRTPQDRKEADKINIDDNNHQEKQTDDENDDTINTNVPMNYGPCLWFFFGRGTVDGRPEHTDSVSQDATWHYQLSGNKTWTIRPTLELMQSSSVFENWPLDKDGNGGLACEVQCHQGDVLVVNTRLWWHKTTIAQDSSCSPSVSYARDVYFTTLPENCQTSSFVNVDGMYAPRDIPNVGTIIFTEANMPSAEMHRSIDPNCQVVALEDGSGAVVSLKPIKAGEFLHVSHSSDEENEDDDDDDDDDDQADDYGPVDIDNDQDEYHENDENEDEDQEE